jgi:hypothetical protein
MYIKKKVLEEGELFYCKDKSAFYGKTIKFVRRFEDFKPRYKEYPWMKKEYKKSITTRPVH